MSYTIESKPASKNSWHTPAEAKAYYGRYSRSGITIHWWGGGESASAHDSIVNYFLAQGRQGVKSVNYVLSDKKITNMVHPDNVAWCSQSGNPTTVSIECQPTLGAEGYKKAGWLIYQIERRYGKKLPLYPHKYWFPTSCPGSLNLTKMRQEADKWRAGAYNPKPTPKPVPKPAPKPAPVPTKPPAVKLKITDIPNKKVKLIRDTNLWDLHFTDWKNAKSVKPLKANTEVEVSAIADHPLGGRYYLSEYSHQKGIGNGINIKDTVDIKPTPASTAPTSKPVTVTVPAEVPKSEPVKTTAVLNDSSAIQKILEIIRKIAEKLGIKI